MISSYVHVRLVTAVFAIIFVTMLLKFYRGFNCVQRCEYDNDGINV